MLRRDHRDFGPYGRHVTQAHDGAMTAIQALGTIPTRVATFTPAVAVAPAAIGEKPNYVAIYASSIFAMSMLFLIGVGLPMSMAFGNAAGWANGAFCAFWGGPGFGVMVASARASAWQEKHAAHD